MEPTRNETVIDFSDGITFLVGPNGYGKTTIFDAIELGLTGNLSRINKVTGENIVYNKPFFQNEVGYPVIIKLWLEKMNGEQLVIVRRLVNNSTDCKNIFAPLKSTSQFKLFRQVEVSEENFTDIDNFSTEKLNQSSIDEFLGINGKHEIDKIFNLFNYIQQEETTFFLKQTEQERGDSLSFLVKTDKVEEEIKDINAVANKISRRINDLDSKLKNLKQQELSAVPYQRLFTHREFAFDIENPFSIVHLGQLSIYQNTIQNIIDFKQNFSIEEYNRKIERDKRKELIDRDSTIKEALYFSMLSPIIDDNWDKEKYLLKNPEFLEYVLLENYLESYESIKHDYNRRQQLKTYLTILSTKITEMTEHSIASTQNDSLSDDFKNLRVKVEKFHDLRNNSNLVDKNLSELRQIRRDLDVKFEELRFQHVDKNKCPFCNSQFQTFEKLKQAYDSYSDYINKISSQNSLQLQEVQSSINSLVDQLKKKIIDELDKLNTKVDEPLFERLKGIYDNYKQYEQSIDRFKIFIQEYTSILPFELGTLNFDTYNEQYQLKLNEFCSKLVVDDELYDLINLENAKQKFKELSTEFSFFDFSKFQFNTELNQKISQSLLEYQLKVLKEQLEIEIDRIFAIDENRILDTKNIFSTYFNSKTDLLESINIENLEQKKYYLDSQHKLIQNQQFQDFSRQIEILQKTKQRLEEINNINKEEVRQFKINIVKQLRIPFFIYSAKMLQNFQQGLGIFLTYKKTTDNEVETIDESTVNEAETTKEITKTVIRFKSDSSNDHDAINQLSTGQLAVVSLAFTLSLNTMFKISDNLNFLMIDDPVQDMDAMNVLSFIEILRHGIIDRYQLILSTYSDYNALFMGYKFANSSSEVNISYKNVRDIQE